MRKFYGVNPKSPTTDPNNRIQRRKAQSLSMKDKDLIVLNSLPSKFQAILEEKLRTLRSQLKAGDKSGLKSGDYDNRITDEANKVFPLEKTSTYLQSAVSNIEPRLSELISNTELNIKVRHDELLFLKQLSQSLKENYHRQSINFWIYIFFIIVLVGCTSSLYVILLKRS